MPLVKITEELPEWAELKNYEILRLEKSRNEFVKRFPREKLFLYEGSCTLDVAGKLKNCISKSVIDLGPDVNSYTLKSSTGCLVIRAEGDWGNETGNSGFFTIDREEGGINKGDPVDYPHNTNLDNHYHDCDEYWIIYEGELKVVSEGNFYTAGPGDCVATMAGDHHDMADAPKEVHGVYMETTLKGEKRKGHLWIHTHGKPEPPGGER